MIITITILLFTLLLVLESEKEKRMLSYERITFSSKKIKENKKIIFITDLHDHTFGKKNIDLVESIKKEKPDYILIGGDIIVTKHKKTNFRVLNDLLMQLKDICPIIYANGNHEQRLYREYEKNEKYSKYLNEFKNVINNNNIIYLNDSKVSFDEISIYGFNLDKKYFKGIIRKELEKDYINKKLGKIDPNQFNILLAHTPQYLDEYQKWGADLGLHGHFHGGVVRIGKQGVLTSEWQLFHKWCVGQFKINQSLFVVSRGLGGHTIDVRLHNPPEITIINLQKED